MMKKIFFILIAFVIVSCIKNDIPYPKLPGDIIAFEVEGQVSCTIDDASKSVEVVLREDADISNLTLKTFEVSNNAKVTPSVSSPINLSQPITYTLTTFQDYIWTISAKQQIDRYFKVKNQIGEALFDLDSKIVLVTVASSQDLKLVNVLSVKLGPVGAEMSPNPMDISDYSSTVEVNVSYSNKVEKWKIMFIKSAQSLITGSANAFAKSAILSGQFLEGSGSPTFEYKKVADGEWLKLSGGEVKIVGGEFSGEVKSLEPNTEYVFRAVMDNMVGEEKKFTTEAALQVKNSDFEEWFKDGKTWYPNKDFSNENYWWDSGNKGTNTVGEKNPTSPEENIVVKGKAVKLASTAVIGVFAAGSIYTGKYVKTVGAGAQLDFGRPFKSRPKGFKGHFNYTPGVIDKTKEPYNSLKGVADSCYIYALLTDWNTPFEINTNAGKFIDMENDAGIIAKCELVSGEKTNGYKEFNLEFKYKSLTRIPNYILIVAAASKYGDYFTGSTSTVLYVDEFELVY